MAAGRGPGVTRELAEYGVGLPTGSISEATLALAKKSIADGLLVALGGTGTPLIAVLRRYLESQGYDARATLLAAGLSPRTTALFLGSAMHACEFDDVYLGAEDRDLGLHATAAVLPVVIAVGRTTRCSGAEALAGYLVGVEGGCRVFDATAREHVLNGLHSLGTCGVLGAALSAARLRGLDAPLACSTLGIAASHAGGVREHFGTMMKAFHAGKAAEGGVIAAELAESGLTAALDVLEAPRGFFNALGGGWDPERIVDRIGRPTVFEDRGVWLKPWPCGGLSHAAITALSELAARESIDMDDVETISVRTTEGTYGTLIQHQPRTGDQAKFSMEFCCVAPFLFEPIGLQHFTDAIVDSPRVRNALERVRYQAFTERERVAGGFGLLTTLVDVHLKDGRTLSVRADTCLGGPSRPMSWDDVVAKGEGCLRYAGLDPAHAKRVAEVVESLETLPDLDPLVDAVEAAQRRP